MASAFDELSHKTALVLRAYVAAVCQEGHSYSETEAIRDAMKQYFEDTFGCRGADWKFVPDRDEYSFMDEANDEERGHWTGNPVFDPVFVSTMQELKAQEEKSQGARQAKRRTAIGYEDMAKFMLHLQKPTTIKAEGEGHCLFFQAFAATAFTLWLTFEEVLKLKRGHFRFRRSDSNGPPLFVVTVPFRNSNPIDPLQANVYDIYPQKDEQHSCCVTKLCQWIQWIEMQEFRQLMADEFLFPQLTNDDSIQVKKLWSVTQLSTLMNKYANDSGLMDHRYTRFDTHSLRRGGAQHRLKHAQDPWPFKAIKWWGGWTEKEPVERILEYLLDDYQYEASFGDMMSPHGSKAREHTDSTRHIMEVHTMREVIQSMDLRHTVTLARIEKENQDLRQQLAKLEFTIAQKLDKAVSALTPQVAAETHHLQPHLPSPSEQPCLPSPSEQPCLPSPSEQPCLSSPSERPHQQQGHRQTRQQQPKQQRPEQQPKKRHRRQLSPKQQSRQQVPEPCREENSYVPPVAHWWEAIQQWDIGDPENNLTIPLREWDAAMRRGNRSYYDRKLVATEFEFYGRSENKMRQVYGDSLDGGVRKLLTAIRWRRSLGQQQPRDDFGETQPSNYDNNVGECEQEEDRRPQRHKKRTLDQGTNSRSVIPKISSWKDAIRQWEEGDPENGLALPLSKWKAVPNGSKGTYAARQVIIEEFELLQRDEEKMHSVHGKSMDTVKALLQSIRSRRNQQEKDENAKAEAEKRQIQEQRVGHSNGGGDTTVDEQPPRQQQAQYLQETIIQGTGIISAQRIPKLQSWKDAVRQWEEGDPENGLTMPLRDWPAEMLTQDPAKRIHLRRKHIMEEFEFFGRSEELMRLEHGPNMDTIAGLISALQARRKRQRMQEQLLQGLQQNALMEQGGGLQPRQETEEHQARQHQVLQSQQGPQLQKEPQPFQGDGKDPKVEEQIQLQDHPWRPLEESQTYRQEMQCQTEEEQIDQQDHHLQQTETNQDATEERIRQQEHHPQQTVMNENVEAERIYQPNLHQEQQDQEEPLVRKRRITFEDEGQSPTKKVGSSSA
ncbi:hypothetical protein BGZ74_000578 [Mortierella antarctica]|nr:hypothetical protein BGZ74_000578 [Mortierella antarctica]